MKSFIKCDRGIIIDANQGKILIQDGVQIKEVAYFEHHNLAEDFAEIIEYLLFGGQH